MPVFMLFDVFSFLAKWECQRIFSVVPDPVHQRLEKKSIPTVIFRHWETAVSIRVSRDKKLVKTVVGFPVVVSNPSNPPSVETIPQGGKPSKVPVLPMLQPPVLRTTMPVPGSTARFL